MAQPGMVQSLAEAAKEMAKVDGVPILNVTRMGGSIGELQAVNDAPPEAEKPKEKGGIGGIAGRLGGFGRKTESADDDKKEAKPGAGMLMEMTTERSIFSTAPVDASKFEVPAGFKEVQSDIAKRAR
jgi:hypothetical protein